MKCDHGHDRRAGDVCLPWGIDEHVHFGLSFGGTMSATWETESIAAAVGGTPARCGASRPVPRLTPCGRAIVVSRYGTPVRGPCQGPSGLHRVSSRPLAMWVHPPSGNWGCAAFAARRCLRCATTRYVEDLVTSCPMTGAVRAAWRSDWSPCSAARFLYIFRMVWSRILTAPLHARWTLWVVVM
jgi:hypothetical protein